MYKSTMFSSLYDILQFCDVYCIYEYSCSDIPSHTLYFQNHTLNKKQNKKKGCHIRKAHWIIKPQADFASHYLQNSVK